MSFKLAKHEYWQLQVGHQANYRFFLVSSQFATAIVWCPFQKPDRLICLFGIRRCKRYNTKENKHSTSLSESEMINVTYKVLWYVTILYICLSDNTGLSTQYYIKIAFSMRQLVLITRIVDITVFTSLIICNISKNDKDKLCLVKYKTFIKLTRSFVVSLTFIFKVRRMTQFNRKWSWFIKIIIKYI